MENITISKDEYAELLKKAEAYDKMIADRRKGADAINSISAEERTARAKKAAAARWANRSE